MHAQGLLTAPEAEHIIEGLRSFDVDQVCVVSPAFGTRVMQDIALSQQRMMCASRRLAVPNGEVNMGKSLSSIFRCMQESGSLDMAELQLQTYILLIRL